MQNESNSYILILFKKLFFTSLLHLEQLLAFCNLLAGRAAPAVVIVHWCLIMTQTEKSAAYLQASSSYSSLPTR